MRTTRDTIDGAFGVFVRSIGGVVGTGEGHYGLDNQPAYGGWVIVRYGRDGSEDRPFGGDRMAAGALVSALRLATDAVRLATHRDAP